MEHVLGFCAQDICEAARHARAEVEPERAEDEHDAARHVFAAVLTDAFHNRKSAGVADGEAFAAATRDEELARSSAVENRVAGKNVAATRSVRAGRDR